jgi:hypothetical protein
MHWPYTDLRLLLDLPPESLYRLLRLADTGQFSSRLSIEASQGLIIVDCAILLAFFSKHAAT